MYSTPTHMWKKNNKKINPLKTDTKNNENEDQEPLCVHGQSTIGPIYDQWQLILYGKIELKKD